MLSKSKQIFAVIVAILFRKAGFENQKVGLKMKNSVVNKKYAPTHENFILSRHWCTHSIDNYGELLLKQFSKQCTGLTKYTFNNINNENYNQELQEVIFKLLMHGN